MIQTGDRVVYKGDHGAVVKYVPAQGSFMAVCVIDLDKGLRCTVRAADVVPEDGDV